MQKPSPRALSRLLLACAALAAAPLSAQEARREPENCHRERPRRDPDEAARDSVRRTIRMAIRDDARESARAAGVAEPSGLILILFDRRAPAEASIRTHRTNVPDSVLAGVLQRALPRLTSWPLERGDSDVALYSRLDADIPPDSGATTECEPGLANRTAIARLIGRYALTLPPTGNRETTHLKMLLTRDGEIAYAEVDRPSREPRLDAYLLSLVPRMEFTPAAVDGKTVDVWVTLPLTVVAPDPPRYSRP
ncbi:MAG TPA: hypothetical protein VF746_32430 [Longimicrobium sp.]|jgi:hypothetical protein